MPAEVWLSLLGMAALIYAAWCWAGQTRRARSWAGKPLDHPIVLGMAPGGGLMLVGAAIPRLFYGRVPLMYDLLVYPGVIVATAGVLIVIVFSIYHPRWWGPRWFHRMSVEKKVDVRDPLNAAGMTVLSGWGPGSSANKASRAFGSSAQTLNKWRGGYVYDPDTKQRTHGMAQRGAVIGKITLYAEGVTFAANKSEDALRQQETVLVLPIEQITGARVVPARAGVDGVPRRGRLYRSPLPRLVIDTSNGSYLFDLDWGGAKKAAEQIRTTAGLTSGQSS